MYRGYVCDACDYAVGGARIICLDCQPENGLYIRTVDLCDDPECYGSTVDLDKRDDLEKPHIPEHDLLKVRNVLQLNEQPDMDRRAKKALDACRAMFEGPSGEIGEKGTNGTGQHELAHPEVVSPEADEDDSEEEASSTAAQNTGLDQSDGPGDEDVVLHDIKCGVCQKQVEQPCWFCVDCYEQGVVSSDGFDHLRRTQNTF